MKVPAEQLHTMLGLTGVQYIEHAHSLAIVDTPLAGMRKEKRSGTISSREKANNQIKHPDSGK